MERDERRKRELWSCTTLIETPHLREACKLSDQRIFTRFSWEEVQINASYGAKVD